MAETKDQIAAERDQLRADNDRLRAQLAAAVVGGGRPATEHQFVLSEGDRAELARTGMVNIGGVLKTRAEVEALLGDGQVEVDLGDAEPDAATLAMSRRRAAGASLGVDYVWPSVAPGRIDPAVAGTPGINGPVATTDVSRETDGDVSRETDAPAAEDE